MKSLDTVKTKTSPLTAKHPLYPRWRTIINRCFNPKSVGYVRYGGRGISVCERWLSFPAFVEDMGMPPQPNMQIDRTDNNLGYSPSNCQWVTPKQNTLNRSNNVVCTFQGVEKTVSEWAEHLGLRPGTLFMRLKHMGIDRALSRPVSSAKGSDFVNRTTLTEETALAIKHSSGSLKVVARQYGVSLSTVSSIRNGKTWKHII